jgi:hypothetical protein
MYRKLDNRIKKCYNDRVYPISKEDEAYEKCNEIESSPAFAGIVVCHAARSLGACGVYAG